MPRSTRPRTKGGRGSSRFVVAALLAAATAAPAGLAASQGQTPPGQAQAATPVSDEVYQGWKMFHVYCYRCHGTDAIANPGLPGPDLRKSVQTLSYEEFEQVVKEGRLAKGMPAWGPLLTDQQIQQVHAYLEARASGALKPGRPDEQ